MGKEIKQTVTITFDRLDGSSRATFDNFDDAILFAKEIEKQIKEGTIKVLKK